LKQLEFDMGGQPDLELEDYEELLKENEKKNKDRDHNKRITNYLATFIKRNKKLIHLDLSQT